MTMKPRRSPDLRTAPRLRVAHEPARHHDWTEAEIEQHERSVFLRAGTSPIAPLIEGLAALGVPCAPPAGEPANGRW